MEYPVTPGGGHYVVTKQYEPTSEYLRDQFAMAALTGMLADVEFWSGDFRVLARSAYECADVFLEARKAQP